MSAHAAHAARVARAAERRANLVEDLEWLLAQRVSPWNIHKQVNCPTSDALRSALRRAGRRDLADRITDLPAAA